MGWQSDLESSDYLRLQTSRLETIRVKVSGSLYTERQNSEVFRKFQYIRRDGQGSLPEGIERGNPQSRDSDYLLRDN